MTKPITPLVIIDGDSLTGFSVDLWAEMARRLRIEYEWIKVNSVAEQLEALQQGKADVAIAGISMTPEREEFVDFTFPFMEAGLQILVGRDPENFLSDFF